MVRLTGGLRTKAPCNPDAADAGISRRLDICSGVTYHHTVLLAHTSEFKQIAYNLGGRLERSGICTSDNSKERNFREKVTHYGTCTFLILVGSHRYAVSSFGQFFKKCRYPGIRTGMYGAVTAIIVYKSRQQTVRNRFISLLRLRQCSLNQLADTIAYHHSIFADSVQRTSGLRKDMIDGSTKIFDGIHQSSVKIEYYKFSSNHISIQDYSLILESIIIVTGPSLTREHCMFAPNTPFSTGMPDTAESLSQYLSYSAIASS